MLYTGLAEISKITERIYIGTFHAAEMLEYGNRYSITHVLNCTKDQHKLLRSFNVRQINIDDGEGIPAELVTFAINTISEAVRGGGIILVHCHAGISRSPSLVAAYLTYCGFSWDEAVEFIRHRRPQIMPHHKIAISVRKALGQYINSTTTVLGS